MFPTEYNEDVEMTFDNDVFPHNDNNIEDVEMAIDEDVEMTTDNDIVPDNISDDIELSRDDDSDMVYSVTDPDGDTNMIFVEDLMAVSAEGISTFSGDDPRLVLHGPSQDIEMTTDANIEEADAYMQICEWLNSLPTSLNRYDKSAIAAPWEEQIKSQKPPAPMFYTSIYNHHKRTVSDDFSWDYNYGQDA
ncbi:hypothetical protein SCUCBS95973_002060 [Sporothrix curviconia]|uniref:Uncharacterized protein n=1 Tax=Sporothrix curviconia TaxID=1260050 RepID=A0ABP0B3X7_9PEZI